MLKFLKTKEGINYAFVLLFMGIIIRAFYQEKYGVMMFQHDWYGHVEMIKYIANNWSIPLPGKGLEFPQQSLYYIVTAGIYSSVLKLGFTEGNALEIIGYFSFFCSVLFLVYGYKFITLLTKNREIQAISMIFLALTPSLVYLSARINNDALVMALGAISLYYIIKSYQTEFKLYFYKALVLTTLLFLTKISTLGIELLFFALLIVVYQKSKSNALPLIQNRLYAFGLVGMFLVTFTLWRVYLPIDDSFHLVNSGIYPKQELGELNFNYFLGLKLQELLKIGQSYVFGNDAIRHSFMTYQFGTMFFGEFDYSSFTTKTVWLKEIMQGVLLFGTIFIVGFVTYILKLYSTSLLQKLLFVTMLINFTLILKFMFDFPSICNTDFRYFVSSFLLFAYIFAQGLHYITWLRLPIRIVLSLLVISEVLFFIKLLY